jgi:anti-anti-sigma factor
MEIEQSTSGHVNVVAPSGRIDTTTSPSVEDTLQTIVSGGARDLVVDLRQVEYISSAGLRVLLVAAKRIRDLGGRLVLCDMTEPVRQVFQLAGFLPLFAIEPSREAAVARLGQP